MFEQKIDVESAMDTLEQMDMIHQKEEQTRRRRVKIV